MTFKSPVSVHIALDTNGLTNEQYLGGQGHAGYRTQPHRPTNSSFLPDIEFVQQLYNLLLERTNSKTSMHYVAALQGHGENHGSGNTATRGSYHGGHQLQWHLADFIRLTFEQTASVPCKETIPTPNGLSTRAVQRSLQCDFLKGYRANGQV